MSDTNTTLPRDFDPLEYLDLYPDVAASGMDAAEHYLLYGRAEGRPFRRAAPVLVSLERPVFFCHIPKTAGTSVRRSLERGFVACSIIPDQMMIDREFGNYPSLDLVVRTLRQQRRSIRLVRGHYHLNLRYEIDRPIIITMLRDPIARTVSQVRHEIQNSGLTLQEAMNSLDAGVLPRGVLGNLMTRYLGSESRYGWRSIDIGRPIVDPTERLASAIEALSFIDILGVDAVATINGKLEALGFEPVRERANVSTAELNLSDQHIQAIAQANSLDLQLHEMAKKLVS